MLTKDKKVYGGIFLFCLVVLSFLIYILYYKERSLLSFPFLESIPVINALLNSLSSLFLILGFFFIKTGRKEAHKKMMLSSLVSTLFFLLGYVTYHYFHGATTFEGIGLLRIFYFFVLITHIFCSGVALPLIIITFYHGFSSQWDKHKKWARITFPLWLYVSVTGVSIYFFLNS